MREKTYLVSGLTMCLLIVLCLLTMEISGNNQSFESNSVFKFVFMFAPVIIWYAGIKAKKKALGGVITWRQAVSEGVRISLVFALVSPFIFLIYYIAVNPGIISTVREVYGMTTASTGLVVLVDLLVQAVSSVVFGTVLSILLGLILRTKPARTNLAAH